MAAWRLIRRWLRQKRGAATGPNPCDRGKPGSKHLICTDEQGVPVAAPLSAANVAEGTTLLTLAQPAEAVFATRHKRVVHADKAYDRQSNRLFCRLHRLRDAMAQRGKKESALGRKRWVVKRTFAWLKRYRRLAIRHERRADIHLGLLLLACALIAANFCR